MNSIIDYYKWFFSDQLHQMYLEQKTIASTPVSQLINIGDVLIGYVVRAVPEKGHIVIKFPKAHAPRLKVLKSFVIIKKKRYFCKPIIISNRVIVHINKRLRFIP